MQTLFLILRVLADGQFHSGEALASILGQSRTSVWKALQKAAGLGVEIYAVRGRGYRLEAPVELLDYKAIQQCLSPEMAASIAGIEVHWILPSTNSYLLNRGNAESGNASVCIAEIQTQGRGRRGRNWVSPFGGNIYLSFLSRFQSGAVGLGGVSLVASVAVIRALQRLGVPDVGLKWPNDILARGRKLAGILLEVVGESSGPCTVVTGVGLNYRMPAMSAKAIDQDWIDIASLSEGLPGRNRLVAAIIEELVNAYDIFTHGGLVRFLDEWHELDCYRGQSVILQGVNGALQGIENGVDEQGALRLALADGVHTFHSGEVSLRPLTRR